MLYFNKLVLLEKKMLYNIKKTFMIKSAQDSSHRDRRSSSIFLILIIFMLVETIAISIPQTAISSIVLTAVLMNDAEFMTLFLSETAPTEELYNIVYKAMENMPAWTYIPIIAATGLAVLISILYCKLFEKRNAFSLGFNKRGMAGEYVKGIVIGAVMILLPALACHLTKCISFTYAESPTIPTIIIFFFAFVLQGLGEEALFRGYLMTSIARKHNIWVAIIGSSFVFSFFHASNAAFNLIAFINIFLFGIFASIITLKRGSIWMASAIHTAWNFIQGNILGINVSGNPKFDTVITAQLGKVGAILSGGEFGLEGGLGVTVVLLVAVLLALLSPTKESEIAPPEEKTEENAEETLSI